MRCGTVRCRDGEVSGLCGDRTVRCGDGEVSGR